VTISGRSVKVTRIAFPESVNNAVHAPPPPRVAPTRNRIMHDDDRPVGRTSNRRELVGVFGASFAAAATVTAVRGGRS